LSLGSFHPVLQALGIVTSKGAGRREGRGFSRQMSLLSCETAL